MTDETALTNGGNYDVIVYGTVCLDAIWRVERLASAGTYEPIQEARKMIGGEAANTAIALMRWGVRVALVGNAIGEDADGILLQQLFRQDAPALETRFIEVRPAAQTPYCVCIATPDGHRTMYGTGFPEMQCPPLDPTLARSVRFFTLDPNAWEPGRKAALVAAREGASVLAMDYTRDADVTRAAFLNVTSREHLDVTASLADLAAYAAQLRDDYGPTAIITCGENGCFVAERARAGSSGGPAVHVPAYVAPQMIDATGCGDMFRAGLLYGHLQNWDLLQTVRFASAAAALNCGAMGGWGGVQNVEAIQQFQRTASIHGSARG